MELKNKVSFVIPVCNNFEYTKHLYKNIREYYPNDEIVISDGGSNDDTISYFSSLVDSDLIFLNNGPCNLSKNYNIGVEGTNQDVVILLHNDMFLPPNFKDKLLKNLTKNNIISFSRVEPPLFPTEEPGKIIRDFGYGLDDFNKEKFINFCKEYDKIYEGGGYLFIACCKDNYIKLDENVFTPPQMWMADVDLHRRYRLMNKQMIISDACVFHFCSKTSRDKKIYTSEGERISSRNYLRKWASYNSNNRFNVGFIVENCTNDLLYHLEPWCDTIYADYRFAHTIEPYIINESTNTSFNLYDRIKPYDNEKNNDILISFDGSKLDNNQFEIIRNLQNILGNTSPGETYEIGIFNIYVHSLNNEIESLIFIHK